MEEGRSLIGRMWRKLKVGGKERERAGKGI